MRALATILLLFGTFPILGVWLFRFLTFKKRFSSLFRSIGSSTDRVANLAIRFGGLWHDVPGRVPWKDIKGSSVQATRVHIDPSQLPPAEVTFVTIPGRCQTTKLSNTRWRLRIVFEIVNHTRREIILEDIHARVFEKEAFAPRLHTISYFGHIWLMQDNSILKEAGKVYSLAAGHGYEIDLLFEATRTVEAMAYGLSPHEEEGRVVTVFGLLVDYHSYTRLGIERHTTQSDCLYLFESPCDLTGCELEPIDDNRVQELKLMHEDERDPRVGKFIRRLEGYLWDHQSFRPEPFPGASGSHGAQVQ